MSIPKPRICWPFVIEAGVNDRIDLQFVKSAVTYNVYGTVPANTYYTPEALLHAVALNGTTGLQKAARDAASNPSSPSITATSISSSGRPSFTMEGVTAATLRLSLSSSLALGRLLGYISPAATVGVDLVAPDVSGTFTLGTSNSPQSQNLWLSPHPARSDSKALSTYPRALIESTGGVVGVDLAEPLRRRTVRFEKVSDNRVFTAEESLANEAIQHLFDNGPAAFLYFEDQANTGLSGTPARTDVGNGVWYALEEATAREFSPERSYAALPLYDFELPMIGTQP